MIYPVPLFGQKYKMSCWAACMRMILAYKGRPVASDDDIASPTGQGDDLRQGAYLSDTRCLEHWGFEVDSPMTRTEDGFIWLLKKKGPLYAACDIRKPGYSRRKPHARVVSGVREDTFPLQLIINDPAPTGSGLVYTETYEEFVQKNELLGASTLNLSNVCFIAYLK